MKKLNILTGCTQDKTNLQGYLARKKCSTQETRRFRVVVFWIFRKQGVRGSCVSEYMEETRRAFWRGCLIHVINEAGIFPRTAIKFDPEIAYPPRRMNPASFQASKMQQDFRQNRFPTYLPPSPTNGTCQPHSKFRNRDWNGVRKASGAPMLFAHLCPQHGSIVPSVMKHDYFFSRVSVVKSWRLLHKVLCLILCIHFF